jgi:hypothetical protein
MLRHVYIPSSYRVMMNILNFLPEHRPVNDLLRVDPFLPELIAIWAISGLLKRGSQLTMVAVTK